ncbi:toxin-antitoxin system HicB family antitoxin [Tepidibacter hydrothermalis]|uniref:Toxin-antitoxin system HicB family antitoxin n=1 Tax=Tepidibacter hydrothermalis TaxID=3036126 RepID=A0ABY8E9X3_9FIRM|nr:toxin-antitoxin system HicB family antitoxin [Tepidibacter hydrothermalis]WFD09741.1 toxin-antitoxin system HicB family antitoxin [Tepidibacter hydrothermalis]
MNEVRTSLRLSRDTHKQLKIKCAEEGVTMNGYISDLLQNKLPSNISSNKPSQTVNIETVNINQVNINPSQGKDAPYPNVIDQ